MNHLFPAQHALKNKLVLLCLLFAVCIPSGAVAGIAPDLFIPLPTSLAADRKIPVNPTVAREELVLVNSGLLQADRKGTAGMIQEKSFRMDLFGQPLTISFKKTDSISPGSLSWIGTVAEYPDSEVILVVKDDVVQANIVFAGSRYHIRYVGNSLGQAVHALQQIDTSRFPPEHPPGYEIGGIVAGDVVQGDDPLVPPANPDPPPPVDGAGCIIDVMVVYTPATRNRVGGTTAINNLIDLAITETNQGYANSGINQRMNLVYRSEIDYDSNTSSPFYDALYRLQDGSDGYMDIAHTWRDTYKADLVSLWIDNGSYCGLGYVGPHPDYGFQVTRYDCATGYYSFAHEFGHNQGAMHDWAVDSTDGYMHGYVDTVNDWRTIMAYNNSDCPGGYCPRINYWSNPDKTYNGAPMGVPAGEPEEADNRRWLNETAYTVTNFRYQNTTYSLPSNQWHQIAIPYALPLGTNTVELVFGDDLQDDPGNSSLGTRWALFRYDPLDQEYVMLQPTEPLQQGVGYWIIQVTGSPVTLSLPTGISPTPVIASGACTASSGCAEIALATRAGANQWQMLGNMFPQDKALASLIVRDTGSCFDGCTFAEAAETHDLVNNEVWHYNPTTGSYEGITPSGSTNNYLKAWYGYWLATKADAYGSNPELLTPSN